MEAVIGNVRRDLWVGTFACRLSGAKLLQRRGIARALKSGPISRWLYTHAVERIIVNAPAIRDAMLQGVDFLEASRFVLIPNGVDTENLPCGRGEKIRAELGLDGSIPLVACIGRLAPMKGHVHLLRAWRHVRASVPGARLLIAGEGDEAPSLEALAANLGLEDSVHFLGFRRDVDDLLEAMDLLVLPSVRDEGCNNTLLEAMAHGRAAVVTRCGGLHQSVVEGETGIVVPSGDEEALGNAVTRLLLEPEERRRMGIAARKVVEERYSSAKVTDQLEGFLRSLRGRREESR